MDPLKPLSPIAAPTPLASRAEEAVQDFYEKLRPYQTIILAATAGLALAIFLALYLQHRSQVRALEATHRTAKAQTVAELEAALQDYRGTSEAPFLLFKLAAKRYEECKGEKSELDRIAADLQAIIDRYPEHWVARELTRNLLRTVKDDLAFVADELPKRLAELKEKNAAATPPPVKDDGAGAGGAGDGKAAPPPDGAKPPDPPAEAPKQN